MSYNSFTIHSLNTLFLCILFFIKERGKLNDVRVHLFVFTEDYKTIKNLNHIGYL